MKRKKNELTLKEFKTLLRYLQKLRAIARKDPPVKKNRLWESAKEKGTKELRMEMKVRERGITVRSSCGPYRDRAARKPNQIEQKRQQDHLNYIIEGKAEKIYRELDSTYDSKLMRQEHKAEELVKKIDYTITAYKVALAEYSEVYNTLLLIDWKDLRDKFSTKEIMKFEKQELFDRAIHVLEIIITRFTQAQKGKFLGKIWSLSLELYERTIGAVIEAHMKQ